VDDRQSESGPLSDFLGGEEGFEDALSDVFGHPGAVVDEVEFDGIFGGGGREVFNGGGLDGVPSDDFEFPSVGESISGVESEVDEDLFDLGGIDSDQAEVFGEVEFQADFFADEASEEVFDSPDGLIEIEDDGFDSLSASEGEELSGEGGGAVSGILDGFETFLGGGRHPGLGQEHVGVARDDGEEVVEVVGDSSGEESDGFHFLGVLELFLEVAAFGDVLAGAFDGDGTALGIQHGTAGENDPADVVVQGPNAELLLETSGADGGGLEDFSEAIPIVLVDVGAEDFEIGDNGAGFVAEDAIEFVGPVKFGGVEREKKTADVSEGFGFLESFLAQSTRGEFLFDGSVFGDIPGDADQADDFSIIGPERGLGGEVDAFVAGGDDAFLTDEGASGFDDLAIVILEDSGGIGIREGVIIAAEELAGSLIEEEISSLQILDEDGFRGQIDDGAEEVQVIDPGKFRGGSRARSGGRFEEL